MCSLNPFYFLAWQRAGTDSNADKGASSREIVESLLKCVGSTGSEAEEGAERRARCLRARGLSPPRTYGEPRFTQAEVGGPPSLREVLMESCGVLRTWHNLNDLKTSVLKVA